MTETAGQLEAESAAKRDAIRRLNDRLRQTGQGGRIMMTAGVAGLPREQIAAVLRAVAAFAEFVWAAKFRPLVRTILPSWLERPEWQEHQKG
jgi:hypothetical protein